MTVPYTQIVSTARIGGFFRLLFRWRGSIYQVIYGELFIFVVCFYTLNLCYRNLMMKTKWQTGFESFAKHCAGFVDSIPVTFVLGFYVIHAVARRWTQWENIPWPDKLAFDVSGHLIGTDVKTKMLRRTLMRYVNLANVLCFRDISIAVRKRFPSLQHVVEAGLMNESELEQFHKSAQVKDSNWWIPFHWAYCLIYRMKIEGKLVDGSANKLQDGVLDLRQKCFVLFGHDWISIPLVYTQVATLAVYLFMLTTLFGRQPIGIGNPSKEEIDLLVPIFPFLQVIFYLGWLKVGEVISNPFGGDPDDFEMNYIVDRNLRISYSIVDEGYNVVPPIEKDAFWNTVEPEVPHTAESSGLRTEGFIGSAVSIDKPVAPPDEQPNENGVVRRRSNSIRSTFRSSKLLGRPLSRLLSRTSDRDQANEARSPSALEKGDGFGMFTPSGSVTCTPSGTPTMTRKLKNSTNLRGSQLSRLTSIAEDSQGNFPTIGSSHDSIKFTVADDDKSPKNPLLAGRPSDVFEDDETQPYSDNVPLLPLRAQTPNAGNAQQQQPVVLRRRAQSWSELTKKRLRQRHSFDLT